MDEPICVPAGEEHPLLLETTCVFIEFIKCKFLVRSFLNGWERFMMCDMNFPTRFIVLMNLLRSVMMVDGAMLRMASTLFGSGETPLALTMWQEIWGWCSWTCTFLYPGCPRQSQCTSKFHGDACCVPHECICRWWHWSTATLLPVHRSMSFIRFWNVQH